MITIERILCPIDFSEFSQHALDHAAAIARWYDATITVLHVVAVTPPSGAVRGPLFPPVVLAPEDLEQFRVATEEFARAETGDVRIVAVARDGNPAAEIVRMAESMPANLIVLGTHGRSGFERLVLGSVTERILRKAVCPVLTVPRRAPDVVPAGPILYKRILCAVDFAPTSMRALKYAVALAQEADARLTVVHVLEPGIFEPIPMSGAELPPRDLNMRAVAMRRLHDAIAEEVRTYADVHEVVLSGKGYREILRQAEEDHTDLIVVGAHGGGIGAVAFGSTTNQIVRQATCPVLSLKE